jgi:hypothetical protein
MGFFERLLGGRSAERNAAERLGISIEEVVRDAPIFDRRYQLSEIVPTECARYAVPRLSGASGPIWSLLQREGTDLPNGYLLETDGPISTALLDALRKTADEFPEEFFEFEGTREEVAVFWAEFGGAKSVEQLNTVLRRLAQH